MIKKALLSAIAALFLLSFSSRGILAASYSCYWDDTGTCTCGGPISYSPGPGTNRALFKIDMSNYTNLWMSVVFQDPNGLVLNIGDSPTNNGWGGDGATFYNDAEIQIFNTQMSIYFNQYDYLNPNYNILANPTCNPYDGLRCPYPSLSMNDVLLLHGTTYARFQIQDQFLRVLYAPTNANLKLQSPYLLRIGGKDHEQPSGQNDKIWYVGVNRVISGPGTRIGKGVKRVYFILTDNPLPQTPCDTISPGPAQPINPPSTN